MLPSPLKDFSLDLVRTQGLIGGRWVDADDGRTLTVTDPASGEALAQVPCMAAPEARRAVAAAAAAQPAWAARTALERADLLWAWRDSVLAHQEQLARLLTLENGKPLAEARAEIAYAASYLRFYAEEARRLEGEVIPGPRADARIVVLRQAIGVVGCITPWNFPSAMIARKLAPALAAGCAVVAKPSELTPLSALALAALGEAAGLPPGVLNVVLGEAPAIGEVLCAAPEVRLVSFTGSTAVGRRLAAQGAATVTRMGLELGGNAPFLVFPDADLDAAAEAGVFAKFRAAGQTCVCVNRFLVHEAVAEAFTQKFLARVQDLRMGPGLEPGVTLGPLIDARAVAKVQGLVDDALALGARLHCGGSPGPGTFYPPTVLTGAHPGMRLAQEEIFGPVAAIFSFRDEAEALALANGTEAGLAAYAFTRDLARAWRLGERLETGMVGLNTGAISVETAPFGGIKQSGLGREGSRHGLDEYVELKYLAFGALG